MSFLTILLTPLQQHGIHFLAYICTCRGGFNTYVLSIGAQVLCFLRKSALKVIDIQLD